MREAGSGRAGMAPRRSFPSARRTERRHRSMSGRGSAGETRREEKLSKAQEDSGTDSAYHVPKAGSGSILVGFNKQMVNKCLLNSELWLQLWSSGPDRVRSPLRTRGVMALTTVIGCDGVDIGAIAVLIPFTERGAEKQPLISLPRLTLLEEIGLEPKGVVSGLPVGPLCPVWTNRPSLGMALGK